WEGWRGWGGWVRGEGVEAGLAHQRGDGAAQADDLRLLARRGIPVAPLVHGVEATLDGIAVLGGEQLGRKLDRDRVLLPDIAHVGCALHGDAGDRDLTPTHP